jgi:two-component system NtrC family sensor kinase
MKTEEKTIISGWSDLIGNLWLQGQSIAIGIFSADGRLLDANAAMCYFLDTNLPHLNPTNAFVNPTFASFITKNSSEIVFEGLMTIGNSGNVSYVLKSKVFRKEDRIMVFAEADVPHLFEENKKMSVLNQEVNNLQRELIKEKKNLQNALAELKETQQMLIHSEKMNAMGKLVAGVAHELNNPISFVYSNINTLENYISEVFQSYQEVEKLITRSGSQELIGAVADIRAKNELEYLMNDIADMTKESKTGIERVKAIIEDLRRFSRLDESEVKQIDLIENIKSTISIARSEITRKNINFEFSAPDHLQVDCYPGQLNQALLNVLINALYAVDTDGHVTMTVRETGKNVSISVKDNGCGIPAEIRDRIFDPFFTTKPVGTGTGLGLSITYKIIHDLHRGSVEVDSEPGQGTNIILTIPVNL